MPRHKDLKRAVRARMKKTGEAYTTARTQVVRKKTRSRDASRDHAELAGMSDEAVQSKTGCNWERWTWYLDGAGAASMTHKEIAAHIDEKFAGVSGWWAQMITVGYERIKGRRDKGQRCDGKFSANKSKTVAVPISKLYRAFSTARTRNRWLPGVALKVRKATPEKSVRITWEDGTSVQASFTAKTATKSQVAVQHDKLASKAEATRMKEYWGERLQALAELLSGSTKR